MCVDARIPPSREALTRACALLLAPLHAIPVQGRCHKRSDGCTEQHENAKRQQQEGKKTETAETEILREAHVVGVDQSGGEHEDIRC